MKRLNVTIKLSFVTLMVYYCKLECRIFNARDVFPQSVQRGQKSQWPFLTEKKFTSILFMPFKPDLLNSIKDLV